jgi:MoxR-like ATPase
MNAEPELSQKLLEGHALIVEIKSELQRVLIGQEQVIEQTMVALLASGHVLIEGVPGLGKTLLVRALSQLFGGHFGRIQFTPDLMPSDITGHSMFDMDAKKFIVRKGPVFTNLLLADEINRAPAKTQAALLEVMEEQRVTIDGTSYTVDKPFMVLATQNPIEQEGTYPLPEAEVDRFMLKVFISYPNFDDEVSLVKNLSLADQSNKKYLENVRQVLSAEQLISLRKLADHIVCDEQVLNYAVRIVRATREWPGLLKGAGPRGSIYLVKAAKARALINGESYITPDDIKAVALPVLRHRVLLSADREIEGAMADQILSEILQEIEAPRQ